MRLQLINGIPKRKHALSPYIDQNVLKRHKHNPVPCVHYSEEMHLHLTSALLLVLFKNHQYIHLHLRCLVQELNKTVYIEVEQHR